MNELLIVLSSDEAIQVYGFIGAALTITGITQLIKRKLSLSDSKVIVAVTTTLSAAPAALELFTSAVAVNPLILGQQTATYLGAATVLYRFVVKPLSNLLSEVKITREKPVEDQPTPAIAPQAPVAAAAAPASGFALDDAPENDPRYAF